MTALLFLGGYALGLLLTFFRHPIFGLYTYLFTFYMAPNDAWWSRSIPDLRYLLIAGVVAVLATLRLPSETERRQWFGTYVGRLLIAWVVYNWLQIGWAVDRDAQIEGAILYSKHLIAFYLMYRFANSAERIRDIAIVHVVGCAWFGYQALGAGGGRLERIGGAVAGANELGVHISTGLIFGGVLLLTLKGLKRWIVFGSLPLVANTLVLTVSRGAFLGFISAGLAGFFIIPSRLRSYYGLLGVLGLVLVGMLAHDDMIDRFTETYAALTTDDQELDNSASSRFEIGRAGIIIGLKYPFGAGNRGTELLSGPYITGWDHGRAAHNTTLGIFAEHGFPGTALYLLTILWVALTVWRMRKPKDQSSDDMLYVSSVAAMAGASLLGIYVSGNFSSNIDLETQYWCLALLAAAVELERALLRSARNDPPVEAALGDTGPGAGRRLAAGRVSRSAQRRTRQATVSTPAARGPG